MEFIFLEVINHAKVTSKGRVATSGAHVSDVKEAPVGTKIVLTWTNNTSNVKCDTIS